MPTTPATKNTGDPARAQPRALDHGRAVPWAETRVAAAGTHHDYAGAPLYASRFDQVLKFHAPGLAPVRRGGEAWHIRVDGAPAYARRFSRTFGFYEGVAAVATRAGWRHIHPDGRPLYGARYAWCGNFQGGRCPARLADGRYLHIDRLGAPAYTSRWRYAGDFRDGLGVVQREDGRSTHINPVGEVVHGRWFVELDVFHKGFARARDELGWTHVDLEGQPIYARRFAAVEPFYNGQARVERIDGGLEVIDESGQRLVELRPALPGARLVGAQLGRWRVGPELHRGGRGAIYEAGPGAVLKSSSDVGAWARERGILEALAGDGAPLLLDAFTRAGTGYLALERVEGEALGGRNRTRPRPVARALAILTRLTQTVGRVHRLGWLHTDLHPENVLVRADDGDVVLLDPADAVRVDHAGRWSGEVHWGRWEFVPPEQFEGFTTLDASADTFALVGLLVYLVCGRGPFRVDVPALRPRGWPAVRAAFQRARARPDLTAVPTTLRPLVERGLQLDPAARYTTTEGLLEAIGGRVA